MSVFIADILDLAANWGGMIGQRVKIAGTVKQCPMCGVIFIGRAHQQTCGQTCKKRRQRAKIK